jgi:hypothetical protein
MIEPAKLNDEQKQGDVTAYHALLDNDALAQQFFLRNEALAQERDGVMNFSLSHGVGPAYVILILPAGVNPNEITWNWNARTVIFSEVLL